jgi:hypothetical protein
MSSYHNVYFVPYESRQKRISSSTYTKPEGMTQTELSQTKEAMEEKLKNYTEADISTIPLNLHCRYIVYKEGMWKFMLGGLLKQVEKDYVVLTNGRLTWSVQKVKQDKDGNDMKTRFFKYSKPLQKKNVDGTYNNVEPNQTTEDTPKTSETVFC